eukprot:1592461-Pleurochrysis_carterae.AAC.1
MSASLSNVSLGFEGSVVYFGVRGLRLPHAERAVEPGGGGEGRRLRGLVGGGPERRGSDEHGAERGDVARLLRHVHFALQHLRE